MTLGLTHQQAALLDYVTTFQDENNGVSPSFAEMATALGYSGKSVVWMLLHGLEERGHIRRPRYRQRCIEIVQQDPLAGVSTQALLDELHRRGEGLLAA